MAVPEDRPDEEVARLLMSRVLGVQVERHDDGTASAMHDFRFTLADGRSGAAEMTSITDPNDRRWLAFQRNQRRIARSSWAWVVQRRGRTIGPREVMEHLAVLAPLAEARDLADLDLLVLDPQLSDNDSVKWFRGAKLGVFISRTTDHPGRVTFMSDGKGGWGDTLSLDPKLLPWLEGELRDRRYDGDFAKINGSGCDEQHLVLRIDIGRRIPGDAAMALMERKSLLPNRPPSIPGRHLTGLWLFPEWLTCVVYWTALDGWNRVIDPSA